MSQFSCFLNIKKKKKLKKKEGVSSTTICYVISPPFKVKNEKS
jgi:hypothetical protein